MCVCVHVCIYVCVCVCYRDLKGQKHVTTITTDSCKGQSTEVRFLEHVQCRITLKFHPRGSIVLHLTSPQVCFLIFCYPPLPQLTFSLHLHRVSHLVSLSLSHQYAVLFAVAISSFSGMLCKAAVWSPLLRFMWIGCTWVPAGNLACSTLMPYPEAAWPQHSFWQDVRRNCCLISPAVHVN